MKNTLIFIPLMCWFTSISCGLESPAKLLEARRLYLLDSLATAHNALAPDLDSKLSHLMIGAGYSIEVRRFLLTNKRPLAVSAHVIDVVRLHERDILILQGITGPHYYLEVNDYQIKTLLKPGNKYYREVIAIASISEVSKLSIESSWAIDAATGYPMPVNSHPGGFLLWGKCLDLVLVE